MKILKKLFLTALLLTFIPVSVSAKPTLKKEELPKPEAAPAAKETSSKSPFKYFKNKEFKIIPVPVFETRPDEGNSYGLMPVIILSDKGENAINAIFAVIGQYNDVIKFDGAALAYFYPEPEQEIEFFAEVGQHFSREFSGRFFDPHLTEKIYLEGDAKYLKTPFTRFFGLGPNRDEGDVSNYVSDGFNLDVIGGYYLLKHLRANLGFRFHTTDILPRALDDVDDTRTVYGALPNVVDSTNFIYELSTVFDNRPDREYSQTGVKAKAAYFFSNKALGSDHSFQGYNLEAIHLMPLINNRWTSVFRFNFQEIFGRNTPFYELSSLGGSSELRSFVPQRFVDQGKIIFQVEQRVRALSMSLLGKSFDIYTDPFFEVGRVFDGVSDLGFRNWRPVGGLGFRLVVPPNVVGRMDMAIGSDGFEIYTELGYPF